MALNYAEQWAKEVVKTLIQGSLISPFITTNVNWLNAKTFHFTSLSTSGYKAHSRNGGWNKGTIDQKDNAYTVAHDRDISFLIDKADVDETNATASMQNVTTQFAATQGVPESDAVFFSKVADAAVKAELYSETAIADYTAENVFGKLKAILGKGKLRRYKATGALIVYVRSEIMDLLEQSKDFTRKIEMTQIAEGGIGLETRVTSIDGATIMEVIDDERFYSAFNFESEEGGFIPAADGKKINVLVATPETAKFVPKLSSVYFFAPGTHTEGDGYLYQNRYLCDAFVFPNGKDNKIDSIYVDLDATPAG